MLTDPTPGDVICWQDDLGRFVVLQILGVAHRHRRTYYCRWFAPQPAVPRANDVTLLPVEEECNPVDAAFVDANFEPVTHLPLTDCERAPFEKAIERLQTEVNADRKAFGEAALVHVSQLLDGAIRVSQAALVDGSFGESLVPYATVQRKDGSRFVLMAGLPDPATAGDEWPDRAKEVLKRRAERGEIVACALISTALTPTSDGGCVATIRVDVEHRFADPVIAAVPYRKGDDGVEFGEVQLGAGTSVVFPAVTKC